MEEGREDEKQDRAMKRRVLLVISCMMLGIGVCGGPLITRLYFIHGGNRVWLSSFLQAAGFPIIFIPLFISFFVRRCNQITNSVDGSKVINNFFTMKLPLFLFSSILGLIIALDSYLYSYGVARLPVSTFTLINSTNLAFTALFAFLLVKQRFTAYSINAVVLLTIGAGILAMHSNGDRPSGESSKTYAMGFLLTVLAAILAGVVLPMVELAYKKGNQAITYSLVLQVQIVMCMFATLFCLVGMIANNDFEEIPREAKHFGLGETTYYVILVGSAIIWQMSYLGSIGAVFCASSLFSGVLNSLFVPVTEILAIIFYKETFKAEKGVSLVLSMWGFVSYFYGEYKQVKKMKTMNQVPTNALPQDHSISNP